MLLTGGESARLLADVVPTREHARLLLSAGFAGDGVRTPAAVLYDDGAVRALAARPLVDQRALRGACPQGIYVARLGRAHPVDLTQDWQQVAAQVSRQPAMPPLTRALVAAQIGHLGRLPWVATMFGFVATCADATAVAAGVGGVDFTLEEPGEWADVVARHRFPTRRGRPWHLWTPDEPARRLSARGSP
jgi:hypothetical protein